MSYIGIAVTSAFVSNALLTYGLGAIYETRREGSASFASALALSLVNALASAFLWAVHGFVLSPLGLESLDVLFFAIAAVPLLKFLSRAASGSNLAFVERMGSRAEDLVVGSLVFGVALLSTKGDYSLPEAVVAGAASGLGYWLAEFLLEALRERLELSDLPLPFKGAPSMLISAGLMALAFMGIDAAFIKGLAS
jgi:electron transport complex protein RnfA